MSANGTTRGTPWILAAAASAAVACSAGGSPGDGPRVDVPSGFGGGASEPMPVTPSGAPVSPQGDTPGDVLFEPGEVPAASPADPTAPPLRRRGLLDKRVVCEDGATTSVSGTVYIPSGQLPLYNVMVYVPETELAPPTPGASCSCEISGEPIVSTLTDSSGHFVLENVPVGPDIPIVIQVGDWRREINIGTVEACVETAVPDRTLTLPKNQAEGELPRIAVATGRLD